MNLELEMVLRWSDVFAKIWLSALIFLALPDLDLWFDLKSTTIIIRVQSTKDGSWFSSLRK